MKTEKKTARILGQMSNLGISGPFNPSKDHPENRRVRAECAALLQSEVSEDAAWLIELMDEVA